MPALRKQKGCMLQYGNAEERQKGLHWGRKDQNGIRRTTTNQG